MKSTLKHLITVCHAFMFHLLFKQMETDRWIYIALLAQSCRNIVHFKTLSVNIRFCQFYFRSSFFQKFHFALMFQNPADQNQNQKGEIPIFLTKVTAAVGVECSVAAKHCAPIILTLSLSPTLCKKKKLDGKFRSVLLGLVGRHCSKNLAPVWCRKC